jgi:phosphotransferase system HPr (HPr) family protein
MSQTTAAREIIGVNPQGFHARPAHLFMKLASEFEADVRILRETRHQRKKHPGLVDAGAGNGTKLTLQAVGNDAQAAVDALALLVESGFGEMENGTPRAQASG